MKCAPVAQLDRAIASGAIGRRFESCRVHHFFTLILSSNCSSFAKNCNFEARVSDKSDSGGGSFIFGEDK